MNKEEFIKSTRDLGLNITESQLNQLNKYYKMLIETNKVMNLTAITEENEVYLKHFYDSLTIVKSYEFKDHIKVLDVGTGAGFPGIVLKIIFPTIKVYLLDSNTKRINFLNNCIQALELTGILTINSRAEELDKCYIDSFDLVTSRAVANLSILSELCLPYVKPGCYFIPLKGKIDGEIEPAKSIITKLNGTIEDSKIFTLPEEESTRTILKIKKIGPNPESYPRKFDKIKKSLKKHTK